MKGDRLLPPHPRMKSKRIKDFKVRHKTIKILDENIGSKVLGISHSNIFSNISLWARGKKEKINKWDYFKLKRVCRAKKTINKMKKTTY